MNKPFILCVEDNETDVLLMQRIFRKELQEFDIIFYDNVNDCIQALEKFDKKKSHLPSIMLVDIKLINSNGLDLLKFTKEDKRFNDIPVIMLSSSDRTDDKVRAKELGCDEYYEKPKNYLDFKETIPKIIFLWSKNQKR